MKKKPPQLDHTADSEPAAAQHPAGYVLQLFITGPTPNAARAIVNIRKICEEHLQGHYDLKIVDLAKNPMLAEDEQIIAAPTLIKKSPLPLRRFIGNLSHTEKILRGLDLPDKGTQPK